MKITTALYYHKSLKHGIIDTDLLEENVATVIVDNASQTQEKTELSASWDTLNKISEAFVYDYPYQVEGAITIIEDDYDDFEDADNED